MGENFEGNKECFITGWGTLVGGGRTPNVLQEANIDVWDLPSCNRAHGITGISNQQVCVGKKGQSGGCHGDSGGPWCARLALHGSWWVLRPGGSPPAVLTTQPSTLLWPTSDHGSSSTPASN